MSNQRPYSKSAAQQWEEQQLDDLKRIPVYCPEDGMSMVFAHFKRKLISRKVVAVYRCQKCGKNRQFTQAWGGHREV